MPIRTNTLGTAVSTGAFSTRLSTCDVGISEEETTLHPAGLHLHGEEEEHQLREGMRT